MARDLHFDPVMVTVLPIEHQLFDLERRWMQAVQEHDRETLLGVLAEDFTMTSWASGGEVLNRDQYLEDVPAVDVESFDLHTCSVQVFDGAAVLKCRLKWKAHIGERPWDAEFLISDFWMKRDGRWQVVSRHVSLPNAELKFGT